jgi:hypothetical protein
MIFNRTLSFKTNHDTSEIKQRLVGKKVHVHQLDFEVVERDDVVKIIPHAEDVDGVTTLPITHVLFNQKGRDTVVRVKTHPRRIDVGGIYILLILLVFFFIAGTCLLYFAGDLYGGVAKVMLAVAALVSVVFWIRMELGYFDYVRKLYRWVKTEA